MAIVKEERIGGQRLILGDCIGVVPELGQFDAVVCDPPYSSGGFSQSAISKAKGQGLRSDTLRREGWFAGDAMTAAGAGFLLRELALSLYEKTDPKNGTLTVFTDWRVVALNAPAIESALWRFQNLLVWNKGSAGLGSGFRAQHELAMHFSKGAPKYNCSRYGNVLSGRRVPADKKWHGCEKPIELLSAIVETVAPLGGSVLDPFMGSGTTLVACQSMGRNGVGIELDPDFFEIACRRVEDAAQKPALFSEEGQEPAQEGLNL